MGPNEGFGAGIVLAEISIDGGLQVNDRAEHTTADALPRHFGEEVLDRVEPGGRGWGEMTRPTVDGAPAKPALWDVCGVA